MKPKVASLSDKGVTNLKYFKPQKQTLKRRGNFKGNTELMRNGAKKDKFLTPQDQIKCLNLKVIHFK